MIKYILFYCVILLLFSCKNHEHANVNNLMEIDLDTIGSDFLSIKEIQYIPLETNDSTLIGTIDKIVFRNNCFYVFDINMKVFIFDRNGALLDMISRIGTGPGEYVQAMDMDVDKNGNVYISDAQTKRIIKYSAGNDDDYEVIDIGEYFLDFAVYDDETVYLGDPYKDGEGLKTKLALFNRQTKEVEALRENKIETTKVIPRFAVHYFFRSAENIYYYERFSPFIFSIAKDEIHPVYFLKSQKHPSKSVIDEWKINPEQIRSFDHKYIRDISSCYEAGDYIRLSVSFPWPKTTIFNLKSSKVYNLDMINSEQSYGIQRVYASDGKYFVSCFLPEQKTISDILLHHNQIDTKTRNRLQGIQEDANPIIVLFNYD